jgi:ubiquinone/menaquinone biosynthesis C-methylase UbiE
MGHVMRAVNYWPDTKCAKSFWKQNDLPPYRELFADTTAWLDPAPGERWLDLGCGCGRLSKALWEQSRGKIAEVVGLDCAAVNQRAYDKMRQTLQPSPDSAQFYFVSANFSHGLSAWPDGYFDGVVSGLAIQYAESFCDVTERWTTDAYDRVQTEVDRLLKPGGRFVFSVNVPEPSWRKVTLSALANLGRAPRPLRFLRNCWRMLRYGGWLKREARKGRFHYLPMSQLLQKLRIAGFVDTEYRQSFAGQAYLLRSRKPAQAQAA